ncbi:MAG: energy transducer TonB [Flavobacteriales bacterium]
MRLAIIFVCLSLMLHSSCGQRRPIVQPEPPPSRTALVDASASDKSVDTLYPFITAVQVPPKFPGGDDSLYSYLAKSIQYPKDALTDSISGTTVVGFIIEKDGRISNTKVLRSAHPALDTEALRVIDQMPPWTPGYFDQMPVRVSHHIPIRFTMH